MVVGNNDGTYEAMDTDTFEANSFILNETIVLVGIGVSSSEVRYEVHFNSNIKGINGF